MDGMEKKTGLKGQGEKKASSCFFEKRVTYLDPLIESLKQINYHLEGGKKPRDTTWDERDKSKIKRRQKSHSSLMDLQTYMSIFAETHTKVASDALALTSKVVVDLQMKRVLCKLLGTQMVVLNRSIPIVQFLQKNST